VSISLGSGGLVPYDAQTTLDNRYGDCKDYVALLEALLDAKGIESSPDLINLGDAYPLPKLAVLSPVNPVITYIPSPDLYLDATA
jgi:transglutaminase-like putative cysteine protease